MIVRPTILKGALNKFKRLYLLNKDGVFAKKFNNLGKEIESKSIELVNITTIDFEGWPIGKVIFGEGSHYPVVWENILFPKSICIEAKSERQKLLNSDSFHSGADNSPQLPTQQIPWWEVYPELTNATVYYPSIPKHVIDTLNSYKKDSRQPLFRWLVPNKSNVSIDQPIIEFNLQTITSKYSNENNDICPVIKANENGMLTIETDGEGKWESDKYNSIIGSYQAEKYYNTPENIWFSIKKAKGREEYGSSYVIEIYDSLVKYFYSLPIEFEGWGGFEDLDGINLNTESGKNKFFIERLANQCTKYEIIDE